MAILAVTDTDDGRVAAYASVQSTRDPRRVHSFIVEGRLGIERLLAQRRFVPESFLLSETAWRALEGKLLGCPASTPIYIAPQKVIDGIAGFEIHRGCLALVQRPAAYDPEALLASARVVVALEAVANPDNVGGVFRNAAAFGVDAVLLSAGCADPLYRKAIRTSMAATLTVPYAPVAELHGILAQARAADFEIVALTSRAPATELEDYMAAASRLRVVLLVGNEASGLSEEAMGQADVRVRIPMSPGMDSLNLATATGIVLSRLFKRTRRAEP